MGQCSVEGFRVFGDGRNDYGRYQTNDEWSFHEKVKQEINLKVFNKLQKVKFSRRSSADI